ncbi:MAG: ornithine carbamoyltransferase [Solobacterium sp.]|nr:ornithine carbamoyltransferase [Solobacterium sp.]
MDLKGKDFLTLLDLSTEEIKGLLDLAAELKAKKKQGIPHRLCEGKNIALIFEKTSTRTRCAFEVAASDLGMGSTYLGPTGSQIGIKESIADTARVLAGMYDAIEYRGFGQQIVEELAEYSKVPVYNGLTNEFHPTQILADMLTIQETLGKLQGVHLVFMGDARYNMGRSLMVGCAKLGLHFTACSPEGYFPPEDLTNTCKEIAAETGAVIDFASDPYEAVKDADVIYTDIWVSMGEPEEVWDERIRLMKPYQVNAELMAHAKDSCIFMHCLPSYHDLKTAIGKKVGEKYGMSALEVTDDVFESERSVVFEEAENRMHTIKAVIAATLS